MLLILGIKISFNHYLELVNKNNIVVRHNKNLVIILRIAFISKINIKIMIILLFLVKI